LYARYKSYNDIKCSAYTHGMNKKGTVFFIGQNGEFEGSAESNLGNGKCPHWSNFLCKLFKIPH
jgi:hypothetical protein